MESMSFSASTSGLLNGRGEAVLEGHHAYLLLWPTKGRTRRRGDRTMHEPYQDVARSFDWAKVHDALGWAAREKGLAGHGDRRPPCCGAGARRA